MSHGDRVASCPPGFVTVGTSRQHAVLRRRATPTRKIYGVQFHPEVVHTPRGSDDPRGVPLRRRGPHADVDARLVRGRGDRRVTRHASARTSARSAASPAASTRRSRRCSATRRSATGSRASSSTTACSARASSSRSCATFREHFHLNLVAVDARERFLSALAGRHAIRSRSARSSAASSSRSSTTRRRRSQDARLPRAGHALPGRHRERLVQGPERRHQEPPQRRRPARAA